MRKDFHTHPQVLTAPEMTEGFIRFAKEKGLDEICFTDHMPLARSRARDRMPRGSVSEYCRRVREIAHENRDRLTIRCGVEIDFHPDALGEIEEVLSQGDFDLILGSTHMHVFIKDYENYTQTEFAARALENTVLAIESGYFHTISHPDMFRFVFQNPQRFPLKEGEAYRWENHRDLWEEIFSKAKERGVRLEINPHLAESLGDPSALYPEAPVLSLALEKGVRFSYGSDAHKPESVGAMLNEIEHLPPYENALREWESEK